MNGTASTRSKWSQRWHAATIAMVILGLAAIVAAILTNGFGLDNTSNHAAAAQSNGYKTVVDGPVTLKQHWVSNDGEMVQNPGPIVTIKLPATVDSLCAAATAVSNAYLDNEPNSLLSECNTVRGDLEGHDSQMCESDLSDLAKGIVGTGVPASLRQPFTVRNLDVACHDTLRLAADTASGAANVAILDVSDGK